MNSKGVYTVKYFYKFVNSRGVLPVNAPAAWSIKIPHRIQILLRLLANNKLLTRDILSKRQLVPDSTYVFGSEMESCYHLFFRCVVAANSGELLLS